MRGTGIRVLVVGAGIAGLAAGRTLARWGADVEIVERTLAPATQGAGIYLPGNAVRALDVLGLAAEVAARAVTIQRQRVADHRGRVLFELPTVDVWHGVGACVAIHRTDLHEVLLSGAKDVPVHWGRGPLAIVDNSDEVRVDFTDGTRAGYDLVLGADGTHSTVRRLVFGDSGPRFVGQHARRFLASWPDSGPVWSLMVGRRAAFLTIPVGGGRVYCYCDGPLTDSPPPLDELLGDFAEPVPTLLGNLAAGGAVHAAPNQEVVLDRWSRGPVLLVGDAAHATSPNMAEGAGMAVEDALVLAESLTAAGTIAEALAAYERRRRPRTDWVLAQTHRRDGTRRLPPALRNLALSRFGRQMFRAHCRPLRDPP